MADPWKEKRVIGDCTLYLGDCLEIMPHLGRVDAVVTDPPYNRDDYEWSYVNIEKTNLDGLHGFWFWQANQEFPLSYTAHHIWSKCNVCVGDVEPYESIFETNGKNFSGVFRNSVINCEMNATINRDRYYPHPTQKPIKLIRRIVKRTIGIILDPFMGTGTTGAACVDLDRSFIGIELDPDYFQIACQRIEEAYKQPKLFPVEKPKPAQTVDMFSEAAK